MQDRAERRRQRLVKAAARRIHSHGFHRTSLADVARGARVPAGGIYYYFKSKEDLVHATVAQRLADLEALFDTWSALPEPRARLQALLVKWRGDSDIDARYGCPVGSLCYELAKGGGTVARVAAQPLERLREWCAAQFRADGWEEDASARAEHLVMALQGASLMANALRDPGAILRETERLQAWLDEGWAHGGQG